SRKKNKINEKEKKNRAKKNEKKRLKKPIDKLKKTNNNDVDSIQKVKKKIKNKK
ncbi:hypothetical protein BCR32DRAFT_204818, partial [Anaeromyces robustus]